MNAFFTRKRLIPVAMLLFSGQLFAQNLYTFKGKVTDASSGEGMPFVSVAFKGTTIGTTTDFEGYYLLKTATPGDSLSISYIGYQPKSKAVQKNILIQNLDFQLQPSATQLMEVRVTLGENPAYPIMRQVVRNKERNSRQVLSAYQYETYNKVEVDIDNISDKFRKRKAIRQIIQVMDSIDRIAGEDGKPILPFFISESLSDYYFLARPQKTKEVIHKTKITGIGLKDGSTVSQLVGASFQQYNFYGNWLNILNKDFVSPLADSWKSYYEYYLYDSVFVDKNWCYVIDIEPRRKQDLAFTGKIWIDTKSFALVQIDATIGKEANLNFVEKLKIQQEYAPTEAGAWIAAKTRVLVDVAELTDFSAGVLIKFYTSNQKIEVNKPYELKFYDTPITLEETARQKDESYWTTHRHDSLTPTEKNVYAMIDSARNIPVVKSYIEIANIALNGYKKIGKFEFGPYILAYANNNIEGNRIRLGFKTNYDFSKKVILKAYGAYGFLDKEWKYDAQAHYILKRKPWTITGIRYNHELEQVGRLSEDIYDFTLFLASARFGTIRRAFFRTDQQFYFQTDIVKGWRQTIRFRHFDFKPVPQSFTFGYYEDLNGEGKTSEIKNYFNTAELTLETRLSRDETYIQNDNERISLGTRKLPVVTLSYTLGIKGFFGSDFNYQKFRINTSQNLRMGRFGRAFYSLTAGYTPSRLPYPLLQSHLGNQTFFYNALAFNLMNYFEFVSDTYVQFNYQQSFEGLLFNRIPLIRRLKWRLVGTANVLWGSVRPENQTIIPDNVDRFNALGDVPYLEVGYGIENIFKFIRVDFIHRLTYRNPSYPVNTSVTNFGIKVSTQFKL
jgi:Family of unknown function (DUF5686)/CarboxypepD_reg-like domain